MNRRKLLMTAPLFALGACTVTSSGGTTSVTVDLTKVQSYITAAANFVAGVLANPVIAAALGTATAANISGWVTTANSALASLVAQNGGSFSLSVDTTSVPAFLTSIITALQSIFTSVQTVFTSASITFPAALSLDWTAFQTIVSLVLALVPTFAAPLVRPVASMTEAQALATLGVK